MAKISNDHDLRAALDELTSEQQRLLGAAFAKSVIQLCKDDRVRRAVETALNPAASEAELADAFKAAKGYSVKTYTEWSEVSIDTKTVIPRPTLSGSMSATRLAITPSASSF